MKRHLPNQLVELFYLVFILPTQVRLGILYWCMRSKKGTRKVNPPPHEPAEGVTSFLVWPASTSRKCAFTAPTPLLFPRNFFFITIVPINILLRFFNPKKYHIMIY